MRCFPVFLKSQKNRPTYLHTSRVDDDPVPVTKSKIHSHWEKRKPANIFFQCLHLVSTGYSDVQVLKTKLCFQLGLKKLEMMMKELAEKLIPINSDSHYCKRRHIGSNTRECLHKPMQNKPCLQNPLIWRTNNFEILTFDD